MAAVGRIIESARLRLQTSLPPGPARGIILNAGCAAPPERSFRREVATQLRTIRGRLGGKLLVVGGARSMADSGKITALKTATNNLLTQLKNAVVNNGDSR